jgi:hypothetical protein
MGKKEAEEKRKMDIKRSLKFRTCTIAIILFTLLFSTLTIPSFNVLAQNQTELDVLDETEPEPEPTPEPAPEPATEEIISANLANASLITDKRIYSQGESVNISLLYVPSTASTNLTILSPSPWDIVYIALEEETGLYSFTETNAIGTYHISANISVALETLTLTTEFVVVGGDGKEKGEERGFDLNNASLSVDKTTYALGETVRICLAAPPEVITNFSIINPAGIFYVILPSASGEYEFNPDSAGNYVVNVSLRTSADGDEKFLTLTTEFEVIDLDLEIVFEEPEQGEIEVGEPVKWRQHIFIANHGNVSISNYAVNIPLPEDYSNLSSDARDARCKIQDASQACILHPASCISVSIDLAAGENLGFNIFYQTAPVELEVVETSIDISDLIPPDAFDVGIYKQIETGEELEEVSSLRLSESEVKVKQVTVLHNSSVRYHNIPVCIAAEADKDTKVVELVNGTDIKREIKAEISNKNVSWMVPELSKSNRTFMITKPELIPEQAKAEIDKPVEWQLNVLGTIIRYRTPAPFKTEPAHKIENGTWKKEVVIGSNASVHYSNVTAFTNLSFCGALPHDPASPVRAYKKALPKKHEQGDIKLFLINLSSEKKGLDVTDNPAYNVSFVDTDDNESIDLVRWNVPFLSNKTTFEVECAHYTLNLTPVLTAKRKHFSLDEKPEFSFEYINEEEFKAKKVGGGLATLGEQYNKKGLKTLVTPKETIKTFVYDYKGELTDIEPEIEELREGKFSIKLPEKRAFRAGIYKLKVELVKDGVTYTQEQDFTWGVLAINTHKSIYLPDETAFIGIAVLDNEGHMVCDADVTLTITDPNNKETVLSTDNGLINVSPECSVYGVTNLQDYYTNYTVSGVGTYVMNLTAVTADGTGTKSITDNFTVQSSVDFDIARDGPTRIYPPVPYVMNFTIKANKDYTGLIKEYVPASFVITPQQGLTVTTVGDTKVLMWNKNLVKGETYNIYYEFDAPDISPYLFVLGALEIGNWQEARQWMIASDAPDTVTLYPNADSTAANNQFTYVGGALDYTNLQTNDGDTTYADSTDSNNLEHTVHLDDPGLSGDINWVTVYLVLKYATGADTSLGHMVVVGGTNYDLAADGICAEFTSTATYDTYKCNMTTSPASGSAWTWTEVTGMEAGIETDVVANNHSLTQVYVVVDYTPATVATPDLRVVNVTFDNWETAENKASVSETGTGYHVKEGVNITVNATIANYGTGNVTSDFNVSFFDCAGVSGDWSTWFGNYTYNVTADGELGNTSAGYPYNTTYAIAYWNPSLVGTHNISAWADPDNSTGEPAANVTDNNGSALINVSAWQKYWGNVSGDIVLASAAASNMSTWNWPAGSEGNGCVYIVNNSAVIDWSALQALGRNETGVQQTDDLSNADTNLGMKPEVNNATGFTNNNITQLFGVNRNTTFIVHGKTINYVPIVNSTDMTNQTDVANAVFKTGILWDTSDDNRYGGTENEYDTTDKEDLVFIANISYDADDIDYKIAIPCALNAAIGGDLDFYVELR